jgi:hypothetical protein
MRSAAQLGIPIISVAFFVAWAIHVPAMAPPPAESSKTHGQDRPPVSDGHPTERAEAIARSLVEFPQGREPHSPVARLITREALDTWRGVGSGSDGEGQSPTWLVAILGSGLTVDDLGPIGPFGDTRPLEGIFYAWDANAGFLLGHGGLGEPWPQTYGSVTALDEIDTTIVTASPVPTEPLPPTYGARTPHPTTDPEQWD